jgi:multisubunit Na+/H+ antiporter MnhF subunit
MRWSIADLFVLVLGIAVALLVYRLFGGPDWANARLMYLASVALLTTATLGARYAARLRWRRMCLGYSLFGWLYLALQLLRGGLAWEADSSAPYVQRSIILGILLSLLGALAAHLFLRRPDHPDAPP